MKDLKQTLEEIIHNATVDGRDPLTDLAEFIEQNYNPKEETGIRN